MMAIRITVAPVLPDLGNWFDGNGKHSSQTESEYPEQITKMILKTLGVTDVTAHAIALKVLEPL
ncbi:MAG: hypothetical protein KME45_26585 [Stenomitos rutilans HA7619-LM2]|jgi:hypothetical protein|nr:hypothetical protein [Stenomitos rutilans HA7619-LM2]